MYGLFFKGTQNVRTKNIFNPFFIYITKHLKTLVMKRENDKGPNSFILNYT